MNRATFYSLGLMFVGLVIGYASTVYDSRLWGLLGACVLGGIAVASQNLFPYSEAEEKQRRNRQEAGEDVLAHWPNWLRGIILQGDAPGQRRLNGLGLMAMGLGGLFIGSLAASHALKTHETIGQVLQEKFDSKPSAPVSPDAATSH
jgi:hypothetical protein